MVIVDMDISNSANSNLVGKKLYRWQRQTELMQVKLVLHILNEGDTQSVPQDDTQGDTQDDTQGLDLDSWIENEIANNPKITTEELARLSGKSIITIKRHLAKLKHINYVGSGYSGHWEIIQK